MENREVTPQEYFDSLKEKKHIVTDKDLLKVYDNCLVLMQKYVVTGQTSGMRKLMFHLNCIEKEREIVKLGVDTFVYRSDIEDYIDRVAKNTVKIIELSNYEREIPDEIVEVLSKVKSKFDKCYVVFTDYTGKVERRVRREERTKDPIIFGTFQDSSSGTVIERFYYIGDWVDEYCDLTLDKMVNEMKDRNIEHKIWTPTDIEELREQVSHLVGTGSSGELYRENLSGKKHIFDKIRSFLGR